VGDDLTSPEIHKNGIRRARVEGNFSQGGESRGERRLKEEA